MSGGDGFERRAASFIGRELVSSRPGPDPVNLPMIRQWTEAMGDPGPAYLDEEAARGTGRPGAVAPASMMQAWTMPGYAASQRPDGHPPVARELTALFEDEGYTSVVATDSEFAFFREAVPGDRVHVTETVESISSEKRTALGSGRFITTVRTYRDQHGDRLATQVWRILRFRPPEPGPEEAPARTGAPPPSVEAPSSDAPPYGRPLRPRPAVNADNAFWFAEAGRHRLVIQRCTGCGTLRHPPGPCCPACRSFDWDTVRASGEGRVHSHVIAHHPRHPAFDYPLVVALVELHEGIRIVANLVDVAPDDVSIDMPLTLTWIDADPDLTLPAFRPAE